MYTFASREKSHLHIFILYKFTSIACVRAHIKLTRTIHTLCIREFFTFIHFYKCCGSQFSSHRFPLAIHNGIMRNFKWSQGQSHPCLQCAHKRWINVNVIFCEIAQEFLPYAYCPFNCLSATFVHNSLYISHAYSMLATCRLHLGYYAWYF